MSADLVRTDERTLDVAEQRARLPELVEAGDTEELAGVAHMAELLQLHEKAMQNKAAADAAGRLKVEAEAGIGVIDVRLHPEAREREPLQIGTRVLAKERRRALRTLGYADLQGLLEPVLEGLATDEHFQITTTNVVRRVSHRGAGRWAVDPIRQALQHVRDPHPLKSRSSVHRDQVVLGSLMEDGTGSQAALARRLGYSKEAVVTSLKWLEAEGQAERTGEGGRDSGRGGRESPIWRATADARLRSPRETLSEIARRAGVDAKALDSLTKDDRRTVGYETGLRVARAIGLPADDLRPAPSHRAGLLGAAERKRRQRAAALRSSRLRQWQERDDAVRARGGKMADVYALVRRAEQMSTGARDTLTNRDATRELDSAVLDLMEAASKLHRAVLLG